MLTPTKYMDLDLSVLRISSLIVKLLKKNRVIEYSELLNFLSDKAGEDVKHVFIPALDFLYLIGKVEYHLTSDSLEFLKGIENTSKT